MDRMKPVPMTNGQTLHRYENFLCPGLSPRPVDVWLPPDYETGDRRYPVLYMHDGACVFIDAECGFGVSWRVGQAMTRLIHEGAIPPAIVVGIWNGGEMRVPEYLPARPFGYLSEETLRTLAAQFGGTPLSDTYLRVLVNTVKPFIDATYRTLPTRETTAIMGSSMGGLISLYALCEFPEVFSAAGCVSTHWPAVEGVMLPYLADHLPTPGTHRLYFDYGTHGLDALYEPTQRLVDAHMQAAGYERGRDWMTLRVEGAEHNETAWSDRVHIPLTFLLAGMG